MEHLDTYEWIENRFSADPVDADGRRDRQLHRRAERDGPAFLLAAIVNFVSCFFSDKISTQRETENIGGLDTMEQIPRLSQKRDVA
jgi:hypothetical protein